MFRYQVSGLVEFEQYLLGWVAQFGADLAPPGEVTFEVVGSTEARRPRHVEVPSFTLVFPTGASLTVQLGVDCDDRDTPVVTFYLFHFQASPNRSWRYCRNDYHVLEDGGEYHLHLPNGRREPLPGPVSFEQIFEMVTIENAAREPE